MSPEFIKFVLFFVFWQEELKSTTIKMAEQSKVLNTPGAEKQTKRELFDALRQELEYVINWLTFYVQLNVACCDIHIALLYLAPISFDLLVRCATQYCYSVV